MGTHGVGGNLQIVTRYPQALWADDSDTQDACTAGRYVRGFVAAKTAIEPIISSSTCSNATPRISPSP